jgi:hypothetical protein
MESAVQAISCTKEEQLMTISYHEFAGISKQKAREIVRKVLEKNEGNISMTARIVGIARKTMRRAQRWQYTWNTARPLYGTAMKQRTPLQKLRDSKAIISDHILNLLLMKNVVKSIDQILITGYNHLVP